MEIETKNASLATMAVTIQALHVNGKQMTLAVFRQLPVGIEDGVDQVWGTVRYTIKDEGNLWIVFSKDGRLYRRSLCLHKRHISAHDLRECRQEFDAAKRQFENASNALQIAIIESEKPFVKNDFFGYRSQEEKDEICRVNQQIATKRLEEAANTLTSCECNFKMEKEFFEQDVEEENLRLEYDRSLSTLQQLFIAV